MKEKCKEIDSILKVEYEEIRKLEESVNEKYAKVRKLQNEKQRLLNGWGK